MKTNKISVLLSLGVFFTSFSFASAYIDTAGNQYASAIDQLTQEGIVEGYDDGSFRPDNQINRAEFMKIVIGSMGAYGTEEIANCVKNYQPQSWTTTYFPDVSNDQWYTPYICTGRTRGVVGGYPDGDFKPGNNVNYAEALKIIYGSNNDYGTSDPTSSDWFAPYLEDAKANGIDIGVDPSKEITRGEMAQLIVNYNNKKPYVDPASLVNSNNFYTYKNEDMGIQIELPKVMKDAFEVFAVPEFWETCDNSTYLILNFIPRAAADQGLESYAEIGAMMPFNIGLAQNKDECTEGYAELFNYSDEICSLQPEMCNMGKGLKFFQEDNGYFYEFIPMYAEGQEPPNMSLLYTPSAGELEYMRKTFKVID